MISSDRRNREARGIFDGIADSYEGPARLFSLFQYGPAGAAAWSPG